jgi:hypothetical protein
MKTYISTVIAAAVLVILFSCNKDDDKSERFRFLTEAVWQSDSLLINGFDASGPGQLLEPFKGEAVFNTDGTGEFGTYTGTWRFAQNETELVITSDDLAFPLATKIVELTATSLKITTVFTNPLEPEIPLNIRMTFKAK